MATKENQASKNVCPICNKEGLKICSACKIVAYCCKDHQKDHWKIHKPHCRPFEVKHSSELGRYLVCSRDIDADDVFISESPLAFGPKLAGVQPQCLGCYQPVDLTEEYQTCPRCHWPICGNMCLGVINQQHHIPECLVLSLNTDVADNYNFCYEAITPLRCLLLQKKNPRKWQQLLAMETHFNKRQKGTEAYQESEKIAKYLKENFLSKLDDGALLDMSSIILHVICGILEVNALEITTGQGEIFALYPTACIMEHSCIPNTKYSFNLDDFKINVHASFDIKRNDHICTMYTHLLWGTDARQEHLRNTKYFTCKCKRCSDPTELGTHLSTIKCIGVKEKDVTVQCEGFVLPQVFNKEWKCNICPLVLDEEHVSDLISRLTAQVDAAMENPTVYKLEKLLSNLEKLVHKNHYHCFMANHSLIQLYGREPGFLTKDLSDKLLERKLEKCRDLMEIIDVLDAGNSRVVLYTAVILLELFTALFEKHERVEDKCEKLNYLQNAKDSLEKCIHILRYEPPFSTGHSMINIAKGSLIKVRREIERYKVIEL